MSAFVDKMFSYDPEQDRLCEVIAKLASAGSARILDVGCGYGRNLKRLLAEGHDIRGVEVNEEIVAANKARGLPCLSVAELAASDEQFDILLLSHVIEHFAPKALLEFLDGYLDCLKPQGHLVIATPLQTEYFYTDFDHVRPYLPGGILMVFGRDQSQVQYYSRNKLTLKDVWFRKSYPRFTLLKSRYVRTAVSPLIAAIELGSATLFWLLRGKVGRVDGWIGVFQKA